MSWHIEGCTGACLACLIEETVRQHYGTQGLDFLRRKVDGGETAKPVAWIRFCSDGCYEGPIMDESIDEVRKQSGEWTPLYVHNV